MPRAIVTTAAPSSRSRIDKPLSWLQRLAALQKGGGSLNLLPFECPLSQPLSDQTFANSWTIRPRVTWEHLQVPAGLAEEEAMRFSKEFRRRRPDLNRGWRFCRPYRVVIRSAWLRLLVPDDAWFSVVFGRCCSEVAPKFRGITTVNNCCPSLGVALPASVSSGRSLRPQLVRKVAGRSVWHASLRVGKGRDGSSAPWRWPVGHQLRQRRRRSAQEARDAVAVASEPDVTKRSIGSGRVAHTPDPTREGYPGRLASTHPVNVLIMDES